MTDVFRTTTPFMPAPIWGVGDVTSGAPLPGAAPPASHAAVLENGAPPSSYAVAAALDGEEGAVLRLVGLTFLRGVFILPGLWAVSKVTKLEIDALRLLGLSFGGSATITLGMLGYYYIQRRLRR